MSSSERVIPVRLVDFARHKPEARKVAFVAASTFQHLNQASAELPTVEQAYERGLAEGEVRGRAVAVKELAPVLERLEQLAHALAHAREERVAAAEQDLFDVATQIARRILHGELQQAGDAVLRMARAAIDEAKRGEDPLVLRVAVADAQLLRAHWHELELDLAEHRLQLLEDPRIEAGGVVLETAGRCYEGRPERILQAAVQRAREEAP
jgi:flagellar biosynthesis/type III secretory pathway protein FliH